MHPLFSQVSGFSHGASGAAIDIHKEGACTA